MSSDTSNSGIVQKADQIAFHFYTKLFYTVNQARATEETHSQGKIDKWFNLETPDSDLFTREAREPYRNVSLSPSPGPPPLEIQVLLCIPELTNNQVLIHRPDDSDNTTDPQTSSPTSGGSTSAPRSTSTQLRIEPTPRCIVLETWTLIFVPHGNSSRLGDQALPTIYKHGIPLFRSLYSLLRVLPVWKLYKRLKRRTGGVNRNGHLGIKLRVKPLEERYDEVGSILTFETAPSPSHPPLRTQTQIFSPLPHPLGSLTLSATYLSSPNFELDELESHLSSRFISLDLQGFVPTLSKHAVREEKEDTGGGVRPGVGGARSPPRAIMGATGGGRGGHGHGHGLDLGLGLTSSGGAVGFGDNTSSISSMRRPVTTSTNASDNTSVVERFIIPSRVPSLGLGVTSSSSSSALIPPPRPQYTPLPLPLPFPTTSAAASSSSSGPSSGASGLALHRMRRESSNSPSSNAATTTGGPPSSDILSPSISPHRTSHSHSPHPYPYHSSLSSSPISGAGIAPVPIRRATAATGASGSINPFKGNTLSSASASGSSPSLSIRQGLSSGVAGGGGGSPLLTGFSGSFSRAQPPIGFPLPPSPIGSGIGGFGYGATPSSLDDRKGLGMGEREYRGRLSSESDRGEEWDRDDRKRGASESSRERDRHRRVSLGYSMGHGSLGLGSTTTPSGANEDATTGSIPTRIPPTRKRYSSSFGNRYVGSVGSVGSGGSGGGVGSGAGESSGSTPASVSASTGATTAERRGAEVSEAAGSGKRKEQNAAGGVASFLSTTTDDDEISIFVQDIDTRKPLSGRVREREKRERDREREMERGRERDREEEGQGHDREITQESVKGKGKQKEAQEEVELVTSPISWQRRRSPLSPRSPLSVPDREVVEQRRERFMSPSPPTTTPASALASMSPAAPALRSTTTTAPETAQSPSLSISPPAPAQLSISPNRGPMLTNQDEVEERLKRMQETFKRSLEGIGRGGDGGRRRDKEKEKEKETERDTTRPTLSLFLPPGEGELSSPSATSGGSPTHTRSIDTSPRVVQTGEPLPNPIAISSHDPIPVSTSSTSTGTGSGSSPNPPGVVLHPQTGLGLGLGRGRTFVGSTSTSTSTSTSSEVTGASASQGSEEVIGRMDFYDEVSGLGRRPRRF